MTAEDIALTLIPGLGARGTVRLVEIFGSARGVFAASAAELEERAGLGREMTEAIAARRTMRQAEHEMSALRRSGVEAVASTDDDYPELLRHCPDYPHVLYLQGSREALHGQLVSMVGTRAMTPYGEKMCDMIVRQIAEHAPEAVIVSGLAYGVDGACHRAALQYGLRTVGVVANPLPGVTPAAHRALAEDMMRHGGAVVSELHSQSRMFGRGGFIPRNRIIAGLSGGTVVVESDYSGGSMHTAAMADGYYRAVMAVPGRVGDPSSTGTNFLIKTQRARAVCSGGDVVRELGWDLSAAAASPSGGEAPRVESGLLKFLPPADAIDLESLAAEAGVSVAEVAAQLLDLELEGAVKCLPGNRYMKVCNDK